VAVYRFEILHPFVSFEIRVRLLTRCRKTPTIATSFSSWKTTKLFGL
jgi:hypothetical protein